jgi:hypothetical protein
MKPSIRALAGVVAVSGALVAGGVAIAADHEGPGGPKHDKPHRGHDRAMEMLDTNEDDKISLDEIRAEITRLVAFADLDGDGMLTPKEFKRRGKLFHRLGVVTLFDLFDVDGNQQLTVDEFTQPAGRLVTRYDTDADGALTAAEMPERPHHGKRRH